MKLHVLITGTTGWLGGELAAALVTCGHTVFGASRQRTDIAGVKSLQVDLCEDADVALCFKEDIDVVVHLAGCLGWCSTQQAIDVNVAGTRRLLDAAIAAGCKKFVVASSVAAIGTVAPTFAPEAVPIMPSHRNVLGPWPYALSKSHVEELCMMLTRLHDSIDIIALRIGNTVTAPPDVTHKDGKGISYSMSPAKCCDVSFMLDQGKRAIFPEAPLASIALPDMISCLEAATLAPLKVGFRSLNAVGPSSFSAEPVADLLRVWYPNAAITGLAHYERAGHERDPLYELEPTFIELGWRPKIDLNEGVELMRSPVFLVIVKSIRVAHAPAWFSMATQLARATQREEGCVFYNFIRVAAIADELSVVIVERWASESDLAAHKASPHFTRLVPQMDAISTTVQVDKGVDALLERVAPLAGTRLSPEGAVFLVIHKHVKEDQVVAWVGMATELANATRAEPGCTFYDFVDLGRDEHGRRFVIVESWATHAHLQAHVDSAHFSSLVPGMDSISTTESFKEGVDALAWGRASLPKAVPQLPSKMASVCGRGRVGRILVVYDSSTACTAKMALLVAEGCKQLDRTEVRIRRVGGDSNHWDGDGVRDDDIQEATFEDIVWADGIACGSPTNLGCVSWRMKKFWDDFSQAGYWSTTDGRIGCAFSSVGGHAGGAELVCTAMNNILLNFGFSVFGVTDYVGFKDTLHYGAVVAKAPREAVDRMACRRLGLRLAEFVGCVFLPAVPL